MTIWIFPFAAGRECDLQEMTENCNCNNANGPMPDHSCLFNHRKHSSGLITTDTGRYLQFNDLVSNTAEYVLRSGKMQEAKCVTPYTIQKQ